MFNSAHGRRYLARILSCEIAKDMISNQLLNNFHISLTSTSAFFNSEPNTSVNILKNTMPSETKVLRIISAGIAHLEQTMIDNKNLTSYRELDWERQLNFTVLLKIIMNDNETYVQESDLYNIPNQLLHKSHLQWPPEHTSGISSVFPHSAYDIVNAALQVRKEKNIDAIDPNEFIEMWECKRIPNPQYHNN